MARKKKDATEDAEKLKAPKAIGPYDIITMMFTNFEEFNKLTDTVLDKNFFLIISTMSLP